MSITDVSSARRAIIAVVLVGVVCASPALLQFIFADKSGGYAVISSLLVFGAMASVIASDGKLFPKWHQEKLLRVVIEVTAAHLLAVLAFCVQLPAKQEPILLVVMLVLLFFMIIIFFDVASLVNGKHD